MAFPIPAHILEHVRIAVLAPQAREIGVGESGNVELEALAVGTEIPGPDRGGRFPRRNEVDESPRGADAAGIELAAHHDGVSVGRDRDRASLSPLPHLADTEQLGASLGPGTVVAR